MSALEDTWRKSSYSKADTNCVEVAVSWRKSSYSNESGGACVEVAESPDSVFVRDTQHRDLGHLGFAPAEWVAFLADLKDNRL